MQKLNIEVQEAKALFKIAVKYGQNRIENGIPAGSSRPWTRRSTGPSRRMSPTRTRPGTRNGPPISRTG
ncbi:MAG: hypothetical protein JXD23_12935 [Spirochaetales bacterium]|nr:hypothetical protein [Spirochaetales bacterium]